ncbi:repetitive organellar protein [Apis cerana]|uniref:repetitive organellar protein n=1 Tax=Apis cerana TaxID=7461 RepID=UPI0007E2BD36|nr:repetitive organellar protein [Apis cerana]
MFDDCTTITKMNIDKNKEDYVIHNGELNQKCYIAWSPPKDKKISYKQRYVTCSRSVPHKSKHFIKYRISRSLNFDGSACNSSSENSSFEEDKHLSRSAKIMRALNFNSSPSYYGKTKIRKSLNFNLTPSPKSFRCIKKGIRKSVSLNFNSPLSASRKFLNLDDNPNISANSSLLFSSSDSIDENQNETPSQSSTKEHEILHYSTPNTKSTKKSLCSASFTPLLCNQLKETIDNIVYVNATPNSQSLKRIKGRSKYTNNIPMNTSRNLFHEFHDNDESRSCTPKNLVCIIPESMSAIKRSHKKERSSRRNERCTSQYTNNFVNDETILQDKNNLLLIQHGKYIDPLQDSKSDINSINQSINENINELILSHSEGDMSDTGSLFDYTEEKQNNVLKESKISDWTLNYTNVIPKIDNFDVEVKLEKNMKCLSKLENENELFQNFSNIDANNLSNQNINVTNDIRSVTPESVKEIVSESQTSVTPENSINILQNIVKDSIKKSHKKIKDDNKRKLFSPKVLQNKLETTEEQENIKCWKNFENIEKNIISIETNYHNTSKEERSSTPEKVNSSRLLLSQFNSVKKSHKKDKHNKILSGFLKRQEYFNKDMDLDINNKYKTFNVDDTSECKYRMEDFSSNLDVTNIGDSSLISSENLNISLDKLSPSKKQKSQDLSLNCEMNMLYDSELQELDTSKEEFKIFTPLKRKRSSIASIACKEYLCFYDLSPEKNEYSEDGNISFSRCLTPVPNFSNFCAKIKENNITTVKLDNDINNENTKEVYDSDNDVTGRLTPRNMSTTELYPNLDSIKKSHKKNKRGNISRKDFTLIRNDHYVNERHETSMENIINETDNLSDFSNDFVTVDDVINKSIHEKPISNNTEIKDSTNLVDDNQSCPNNNSKNTTVTPPNCLKTKSYIKLLGETSIKRSHKKVRDKRKEELIINTNELSDDGSIFGDEENLIFTEDKSMRD